MIIPIIKKESDREPVTEAVARLEAIAKQAGIRVKVGEGWERGKEGGGAAGGHRQAGGNSGQGELEGGEGNDFREGRKGRKGRKGNGGDRVIVQWRPIRPSPSKRPG